MDFNQRAPLNSQYLKSNSLDWCHYISVFSFRAENLAFYRDDIR